LRYTSLHTHTQYSDGKNTVEEQVLSAINKGFASIGFSDHGYTPFDLSYCIKKENIPAYCEEVRAIGEKYADKIDVFLGMEIDGFTAICENTFDYTICSVHYIKTEDGLYHSVDTSLDAHKAIARDYFGGNYQAMAMKYLEDSVPCIALHKPDIVGHFDLTNKYSLVDEDDPAYRSKALECAAAILEICPIFEINTGAIARGYRKAPYPSHYVLRYLAEHGCKFVLNSDCHDAAYLDCFYPESVELAKACGIKSLVRLTKNGWLEEKI